MRTLSFPAVVFRALALLLGFTVVVSSTSVGAQPESSVALPDAATLATSGEAIEGVLAGVGLDAAWRSVSDLHPGARLMNVDYRGGDGAPVADLLQAATALGAAEAGRAEVVQEMRATAELLDDARETERQQEIRRNRADAYFRGIHALTQSVAINVFSGNDPAAEALLGLDGQALTIAQREYKLTDTTLDEMMELRDVAEEKLDKAIVALAEATDARRTLETTHQRLVDEAAELATLRRSLDDTARSMIPGAAEAFTLASIPGQTGMTTMALNAYLNAEATIAERQPGCHISWRTIAAVASVEGLHGEYGGRRLAIDGRPGTPIVGLALNGSTVDNFGHTTANLSDTDGGRYDGDPVHDRAVGPLQFIPQTWARWGQDGNGDGEKDPHNIDDAALATAAYLCHYGSLRDWTTWSAAIFGYNHSGPYVNSVKASLDRVLRLRLPRFEGDDQLRQSAPYGAWVPIPEPPPPEEEDEELITAAAG